MIRLKLIKMKTIIKVLNQIINTQKKIIEEHLLNEYKLKKENEMKNYKNICMKLMFFIKEEKEISIDFFF